MSLDGIDGRGDKRQVRLGGEMRKLVLGEPIEALGSAEIERRLVVRNIGNRGDEIIGGRRIDTVRDCHTYFRMKTTLNFDDRLIRAAKARAAHDGDTLTGLIERALRDYLRAPRSPKHPFRAELLTRRGRPVAGLDLDDRNILHERLDGRA